MSVCLTVTKSIALVSAGLNSGLCFGGVFQPKDDVSGKAININTTGREIAIGLLSSLSAAFYGASYFGAPTQWKHPYLLYAGALAFVSAGATAVKLAKRVICHPRDNHATPSASSGNEKQASTDDAADAISSNDHDSQEDSVVLVSESSNHSAGEEQQHKSDGNADTEALLPSKTQSEPLKKKSKCCCSPLAPFTSDCVLDVVRTVSSVGLLLLGTIGGLGEPLALL